MNRLLALLVLCVVVGCNPDKSIKTVDSGNSETIVVKRLDQDLFAMMQYDGLKSMDSLKVKYEDFFYLYCKRILNIQAPSDSMLAVVLKDFVSNAEIKEVKDSCDAKFKDLDEFALETHQGFLRYQQFFPQKHIPSVVTMNTGFNYSVVCTDTIVGIGLEMYLGRNSSFYRRLMYPAYKSLRMSKEYMTSDILKAWAQTEFEPESEPSTFLGKLILRGKILYFLDATLPETEDSIKIGYTSKNMSFCEENESKIWALFVAKNILFSSNENEFGRFLNEGPTTQGMPPDAPSRLAEWTGWQIVRKYMKNNSSVTLSQLMNELDAQKILQQSHYKP